MTLAYPAIPKLWWSVMFITCARVLWVPGHFKWLLTFFRQWPENGSSVHCLFYCDMYFTIFLWAYDICSLLSYVYQCAKVSLVKCKTRDHLWKKNFFKPCPVNGLASCNSQDKHYCTLAVRWSLACFIFLFYTNNNGFLYFNHTGCSNHPRQVQTGELLAYPFYSGRLFGEVSNSLNGWWLE